MLNLPEMISLGIDVQATPALSIQGEISRTGWSSFKELRVDFATPGVSDSITEEKWHDTWFYSVGLTWKAAEAWTLRTGLAYDEGAVDDAYRTPRIPDGNRTWFSLGAGYAFSQRTSIDFAYTHIFVLDGPVDLKATSVGNSSRGNLSGTYKNSIDIFSAQAKFTF
jgi:long-chain fatty acid transport protein